MPKTEYTIENGGLRMEFDVYYSLDEAGNFKELDQVRCTGMFICPHETFYSVPLGEMPFGPVFDAEDVADWLHDVDIIKQIEGELIAAKQADGERRRELE